MAPSRSKSATYFTDDEEGIDEDQYLVELVEVAPAPEAILDEVKRRSTYKGFHAGSPKNDRAAEKAGGVLTQSEVTKMLDPKLVKWDELHTDVLHSVFRNRATNKTNAKTRNKAHTNELFRLYSKLAREYPDFLPTTGAEVKKEQWRCGIDALAADFVRILEHKVLKGGGSIPKELERILESDWVPENDDHERTIYYVAGWVLRTIDNKANDKKEERADTYRLLRENASTTKDKAVAASLPCQKVENAEIVGLFYPTGEFYHVATVLEAVFADLLNEKNVEVFGVLMIGDIIHYLGKQDIGLAQFLPGVESSDVEAVAQGIIESYGNMRGKDFARKRNARQGASHTETTRATLGTIDYLNSLKKKKREKEKKEEKAEKKRAKKERAAEQGGEEAAKEKSATQTKGKKKADKTSNSAAESAEPKQLTAAAESESDEPKKLTAEEIDGMKCPQLRDALRERGLSTTGLKAVLQARLKAPPGDATAARATKKQKTSVLEEEIGVPDDCPDDLLRSVAAEMGGYDIDEC